MDDRLFKRLEKIEQQIDILRDAERVFLNLEANRRVLAAELFLKSEGRNVAEREAQAYCTEDWKRFMDAHVIAESAFNHERRRYELRLKAYDAEHLTFKNELPAIKRQGA